MAQVPIATRPVVPPGEPKNGSIQPSQSPETLPSIPMIPEGVPDGMLPDVRQRLLRQANERIQFRNRKLGISHGYYVKVMFLLGLLQIIGLAFFTKGFLLSRQVLPFTSNCMDQQGRDQCLKASPFEKTVIVVIDALRFDFVIPVEGSTEPYHNKLTALYELFQNEPENSLLLKFIADPPTTTLQRLKGLTTGSLPTFIDAGSNFDGDTIDEDNWVSQLYHNERNVAFVGDDTWTALFNPFLYQNLTRPYDSLNVWDLHSVDNGVIEHIFPTITNRSAEWDVLIGHLLGLDHCGHRYGPRHSAMEQKLIQMNGFLKDLMQTIDDKTLLVVMGDHGMDQTGNHGGESPDEVEAAMFMYSKTPFFGRVAEAEKAYDISKAGKSFRSVNQIDLVSSLSFLMGLPVPYNNLGFPIEELFTRHHDNKLLAYANFYTSVQIHQYRNNTDLLKNDEEVNLKFSKLLKKWPVIVQDPSTSPEAWFAFAQEAREYQELSLEKCKDLWARFDLTSITLGIVITIVALTLLIVYSKLIPSVVIAQLNPQFFSSSIAISFVWIVLMGSLYVVLKPDNLTLNWSLLLGVAIGIANGILAPVMDRYSIPWLISQARERMDLNGWTYMALTFIIMHSLVFTSNSFVIWEDKLVAFWLSTFGFCALFKATRLQNSFKRAWGCYHAASFIIMVRVSSSITLCREEQQPKCVSNFQITWWAIALLFVAAYLLPKIIEGFYKISSSFEGAASLWITTGLRGLMFMTAIHWTLEYLEHNAVLTQSLGIPMNLLKLSKITIARIVLGIALIAGNVGWFLGPLCIRLDLSLEPAAASASPSAKKEAQILGYGNAYGSSYFLLVINILAATLLVSKPLGGLSLCLMIYELLTLLELADLLDIRHDMISVVVMGLIGYLHFFTSGHQATLQSIHWDVAFILNEKITFPFTHLTVILNTLGPFIIVSLCVALLSIWKITPTNKPITLFSRIVENATGILIYQSCLTLSTLIMAAHFRRHLMVWKIFAPRFMLNGLIIICMNIVLTFVTVGVGSGKVVKRWNELFGS
ncbi:unnamed protein product [Kuraishia capsulata CBS 1993]|uniref:Uncharacterized protein n=1 Tax=Kuraishia capsulata CBS 1993 TaxID=1382522 RepID=W6MND7_9ASCO|nr:uncharacterized protein KUCA_T00003772001 [Kuraishia capsulata CBS 1993]CDK27793.1 unnamed protein product [Kuraishia capsulata CBS 1993]